MKALICPLCSLALIENAQGVACSNRHQFDRSKEGYYNLLPVHYKNSREPGDARQQLIARRTFLDAGYFLPMLAELKKIISDQTSSLLDIGCGEGYFTRSFHEHCREAEIYGIDISKAGVQLAAKRRSGNEHYAVASSHALPIADESMDVITRIYAPSKDEELLRTLRPEGLLIIVTPGQGHLYGLREKIYDAINPHPKPVVPSGFMEVEQRVVNFPLDVPAGELTDALLKMTPFAWKLKEELTSQLVKDGLEDHVEFQIGVYRR